MFIPEHLADKENQIRLLDALYRMTQLQKNLMGEKRAAEKRAAKPSACARAKRKLKRILSGQEKKGKVAASGVDTVIRGAHYERPDAEAYFSDQRIAVYTAMIGPYDGLHEPLFKPDNVDYFIVTDQPVPEGSLWKKIDAKAVVPEEITGNIERSRYPKLMPQKIFPDHEISVYVDANVLITSDLTILTAPLSAYPIAFHRHKNRDCVYREIDACLLKGKDTPERLEAHRAYLKENGVPEHFGLLEATVIARRHHDPVCMKLMEAWWEEFLSFSKRDQVSLIDCIFRQGLSVDEIASLGDNIVENHHFIIDGHK